MTTKDTGTPGTPDPRKDPRAHARLMANKGAKIGEIKGALITIALDDGMPLALAKEAAQAVIEEIREEVPHRRWAYRMAIRERWADVCMGDVLLSSSWEQNMLTKAIDVYLAEDDTEYSKSDAPRGPKAVAA